jgi:diacylglycerol kinase family enzyme
MPVSTATRAAVIINAAAGSGHDAGWADALRQKFAGEGITADITLAKTGAEVIQAAQAAARDGIKLIVAGGGDGTQNAVASTLVGSDIAMGILPLGTLNHFARDLHIPLELDAAVINIGTLQRRQIDVAEVNGKVFINNSSLGLYPDIVRHREQQQRRLGRSKWAAFFWAFLAAARRYPFLNVTFQIADATQQRRTPFVFIGNNAYQMEGFHIGERQTLDAGRLSFYITNRTGRLGLLRLMVRALFGRLRQAADFDVLAVTDVLIETHHRRLRVSTDGEVQMMESPLRYRIRPGALTVIAPDSPMISG